MVHEDPTAVFETNFFGEWYWGSGWREEEEGEGGGEKGGKR
jgi:hypothetical protein